MSDRKQQCPTCLEPVVNGNCPYFHTQPSAAGSGAREWLEVNCEYDYFDERCTITRYQGSCTVEQDIPTIMEAYADHCTAQKEAELTAERTRREAAERDNSDLRAFNESLHNLCRKVWEALEPTGEYEGDMRLVEFAKSIRIAKDSAEWSLGRIPELEQAVTAERTRREAAEARVKQDGWYLIYADRLTYDGKKYGREGETNHGGNCLAWYEHAVFWRERAEAAERELEYWKSMAALRGKEE